MKKRFKWNTLIALIAALAIASLSLFSASAAGEVDPPPPQREISGERLEKIWEHQLRLYGKLGNGFDRSDGFVEKVQYLIDKASENGKDVADLQAVLDDFEAALKDAHPIFESIKGTVNSHQGFDEEGKVTDHEKAMETVKTMSEKLREIGDTMNGAGRALHEALKDFREANPRPERPVPSTPEGG